MLKFNGVSIVLLIRYRVSQQNRHTFRRGGIARDNQREALRNGQSSTAVITFAVYSIFTSRDHNHFANLMLIDAGWLIVFATQRKALEMTKTGIEIRKVCRRLKCAAFSFLSRVSGREKGPFRRPLPSRDLSGILLSANYYKLTGNDRAGIYVMRVKCPVVRAGLGADGSASAATPFFAALIAPPLAENATHRLTPPRHDGNVIFAIFLEPVYISYLPSHFRRRHAAIRYTAMT